MEAKWNFAMNLLLIATTFLDLGIIINSGFFHLKYSPQKTAPRSVTH